MMDREVKDVFFYNESYKVAREWYRKGVNEEDPVFAFVSFWIVMNQLYNFGQRMRGDDRRRLNEYIHSHIQTLKELIYFDADYMEIFMERPVLSGSNILPDIDWFQSVPFIKRELRDIMGERLDNGEISRLVENHLAFMDDDSPKLERIRILFNYIYNVRNNLVHGYKVPNPGRDGRLVKSSAEILEICLPELMKSTFGRF